MGTTVEICVEGTDGAAAAADGGADRVELCAALEVGGVTPSRGSLAASRRAFPGELTVLVRPRPGGFVATPAELDAMRRDVEDALAAGADGVTLGLLRPDGRLDLDATADFVERARPKPVTFHRAIDLCADAVAAVEELAGIGVARVLSSGGAASAAAGAAVLRRMVERAAGRLQVQAAAGIRATNVRTLLSVTGVDGVHASSAARRREADPAFGLASVTDVEEVRALVEAVRGE